MLFLILSNNFELFEGSMTTLRCSFVLDDNHSESPDDSEKSAYLRPPPLPPLLLPPEYPPPE